MKKNNKCVTIVMDLMAGSCGKGKIIGNMAMSGQYDAFISNAMPNSGHIYVSDKNEKYIFRNIPIGAVNPNAKLFIGAGSAIDLDILKEEYDALEKIIGKRKIFVHPRVSIVESRHVQKEKEELKSGSTFKGGGAALAELTMRDSNLKFFKIYKNVIGVDEFEYQAQIKNCIDKGEQILIEGSQGADLDLLHSPNYPYVTSRSCSSMQLLAYSGISPFYLKDVIGIIRPYPIRISNNTNIGIDIYSGNYGNSKELTWDYINISSGAIKQNIDFTEKTTVTKKIRRVFEIDYNLLKYNIFLNGITKVVLNFAQHLDAELYEKSGSYEEIKENKVLCEFVEKFENEIKVPIIAIGTGEKNSDIIYK